MAEIINLNKADVSATEELLKTLSKDKEQITDLIFLVKYQSGDLYFLHNEPDFQTKCAMSKLLDFDIMSELYEENLQNIE